MVLLIPQAIKKIKREGFIKGFKQSIQQTRVEHGLPPLSKWELDDAAWDAWEKHERRNL